ncbi:hypothetical protein DER46DRAFT_580018 [Fusarium sp. MPI-SDFR-AT-0072]|nr:hypothetical protein DER46DRAFT_580018 [Fusarium sp. MPI-SDFR-AT-0072]
MSESHSPGGIQELQRIFMSQMRQLGHILRFCPNVTRFGIKACGVTSMIAPPESHEKFAKFLREIVHLEAIDAQGMILTYDLPNLLSLTLDKWDGEASDLAELSQRCTSLHRLRIVRSVGPVTLQSLREACRIWGLSLRSIHLPSRKSLGIKFWTSAELHALACLSPPRLKRFLGRNYQVYDNEIFPEELESALGDVIITHADTGDYHFFWTI